MVADSPFTVFTKYEAIKQTHREHYTNSLQLYLMTIKSLWEGVSIKNFYSQSTTKEPPRASPTTSGGTSEPSEPQASTQLRTNVDCAF